MVHAAGRPAMPISAYLQSIGFFALAIAALFVSAGTAAIPTYWAYLAIFAAVFVASFLLLDPDLARERMRPGGQKPPLGLRIFTGVMFAHWIIAGLDHGRFHWSDTVPGWLQWLSLVALAACLRLVPLGDGREPLLLVGRTHPIGPRPGRHHEWPIRRHPASRIRRGHRHHCDERSRARTHGLRPGS